MSEEAKVVARLFKVIVAVSNTPSLPYVEASWYGGLAVPTASYQG